MFTLAPADAGCAARLTLVRFVAAFVLMLLLLLPFCVSVTADGADGGPLTTGQSGDPFDW